MCLTRVKRPRERRAVSPATLTLPSPMQLLTGFSQDAWLARFPAAQGQHGCWEVWVKAGVLNNSKLHKCHPHRCHTHLFYLFISTSTVSPRRRTSWTGSLYLEVTTGYETQCHSPLQLQGATLLGPRMLTRTWRNQSSPMICCLLKCDHEMKPSHIRWLTSLCTVLD